MKTRLLSLRILAYSLLAASLVCTTTFADVTGNSGNDGGGIPDNDSSGRISTVTITDSEIIQNAAFCIEGLNHNWIGDLIITVSHSTSGKMATLMHRVATTSNPTSTGDNSNLGGTYEFADGGPSIWSAAGGGDTNFTVPAASYSASGNNEAVVNLTSIFAGENTAGTWTFNISDNNGGDPADQTGSFAQTAVKFTSTAVPEPGTMATIVLGTLFGGVFFRRRHQKNKAKSEEATPEVEA